ncbi:MAG: carbohydrate ABC transporter permease [Spirochaetaceae bacterium]|jgi:ABC-type glycerol-3-phosphate transport system permease component|nr:carbohydrate ABC transporter permease [Spirochaetaceae bacterium]
MKKGKVILNATLMYVLLLILAVITIFPLLWGVASSLRPDEELFQYIIPFSSKTFIPQKLTFDAYKILFGQFDFLRPIRITLLVTILTIFFGCIVNGVAAFAFATFRFKGKNIIYTIVLLSFMIPFESIAMPLYNVVNQFRWVDTIYGLVVPSIADGLVLFLFTQFFRDIPVSLIEAARVDGANWATVFIRIILPSSVPVFVTAGLMIFMNQWNSYLWPLLIARTKRFQMIQIALSSFRGEHFTLWACLYAGSIISALIPLFLFLPFQKYFVQGIISSGVKG